MKENPKKEEILQAGRDCFARFGFDKTTLDDIGRIAGLNKASLYYYFRNKEEIFIAVVMAETKAHIADLKQKALAFPDVRKQVRFFLSERIRRYGEVIHLTRLSVENRQKLEPLFDEVYEETKTSEITFLTELLKKGVADNAFSFPEPSASVAESLFYLSDALKHETIRSGGRFITGEVDFSGAIEKLERLLRLIIR
ncbi:MAG: TetR/AcrR family transcriptional regulator [Lewinellaceae bacterium]|jgi:AcrR family transcriptional regulator|nr:TetR/AcrR family transcriptional regulator [Lewinellaceae bacterium]